MTDPNPTDIDRLFDPPLQVAETHVSRIFLSGDRAWKLKKALTLPYLDFATLQQRRAACEREVELNRRTAPELYLGCRAVCRDASGQLSFVGQGEPVEWLIEMRRFPSDATFDHLAAAGKLGAALIEMLADTIAAFHAQAETVDAEATDTVTRTLAFNDAAFERRAPDCLSDAELAAFRAALQTEFERQRPLLATRKAAGRMRHGHGDLHLRNIALIEDRPTLFDCLEFDDGLAEIDTLYDLAFLLMDLLHHGCTDLANRALNRYLEASGDYDGLPLLPLYVALRAAIRCHIAAMTPAGRQDARGYLALAQRALRSEGARLVAVGGYSGTGKTTVARELAAALGGYPWGAVVLRSDVLRKQLQGRALTQRLPPESYTAEASRQTYAALLDGAERLLQAGSSVVLDAVFGRLDERAAVAAAAKSCSVAFGGLWLEAPREVLIRRVAGREGDASDATAAVVHWQLEHLQPPSEVEHAWSAVDAAGDRTATLARARAALPVG
ncbi:AAA family ATPase [Ferrovibrio terrae]|uniref:AAA family ATPase n=1 Tax=Ferrovibrio terrae TaxID=2594003 RepID=A0A516GWF7_9PROT|nr:bifunctional aminoglycoside phosphotransferase/ATP-binding protein [Ferrovibrio terrae]QDO95863.1 AAA family ATPase [Ferrovibrio terrae]